MIAVATLYSTGVNQKFLHLHSRLYVLASFRKSEGKRKLAPEHRHRQTLLAQPGHDIGTMALYLFGFPTLQSKEVTPT